MTDQFVIEETVYGAQDPYDLFIDDLGAGGLEGLAARLHQTSVDKGFYDGSFDDEAFGTKIALIHSEASELLEAVRKSKGDIEVAKEVADILIRTLDLWAAMKDNSFVDEKIDLDAEFASKMDENTKRAHKHGVKF